MAWNYLARGSGHVVGTRDYGIIDKCPHCDKTAIQRTVSFQETCGSDRCKQKQSTARKRRKSRLKHSITARPTATASSK